MDLKNTSTAYARKND